MAELVEEPEPVQCIAPLRPLVAIVGRPNVGKSTLFNRLTGARRAITDQRPGATRDRLYAQTEWRGRRFTLVDTGGYLPRSTQAMEAAVRAQAEQGIAEADLVLFVCDAATGVLDLDREVAGLLQRRKVPCLVVVNKIDHPRQHRGTDEFYCLGLGEPQPASAATGRFSGDLLDALVQRFEACAGEEEAEEEKPIRVVLVGRPNVGKSTLINRLAGRRVSLVHHQPGTTRDTTQILLAWRRRRFLFMDTAGLRRRGRIGDELEFYSGRRAAGSIESADVAIVLLDAPEGCTVQDVRLMQQVIGSGAGLLVAANKWDLIAKGAHSGSEYLKGLRSRFPWLNDYPVLFVSGLGGRGVFKCLEGVAQVYERRCYRVQTAQLNRFVREVSTRVPPPGAGRDIRLLYAAQYGVEPPAFAFFFNHPERVGASYKRFMEKKLRQQFDFEGTPVRISFRPRRCAGH